MRKNFVPLEKIKLYGQPASGEQLAAEPGGEYLQIKEIYVLSSTRATEEEHIVALKEDESIELVLEDDTIWFGDRNTILEVFRNWTTEIARQAILPNYHLLCWRKKTAGDFLEK